MIIKAEVRYTYPMIFIVADFPGFPGLQSFDKRVLVQGRPAASDAVISCILSSAFNQDFEVPRCNGSGKH